jgi:hypothetical protein
VHLAFLHEPSYRAWKWRREEPTMCFRELPGRVFLDTSVVNFIFDFSEEVFDCVEPNPNIGFYILQDIMALRNIFEVGRRADFQLAISPLTYAEIHSTVNALRLNGLSGWFFDIYAHWLEILSTDPKLPTLAQAETIRIDLLSSGIMDSLPDVNDRMLLCDSVAYNCDCFCTRDWKTIIRVRDKLENLPVRIMSPHELWEILEPLSTLWW